MSGFFDTIFGLARRAPTGAGPLGGFIDSLVQKLENCRSGLTDEILSTGGADRFFAELAEAELPRLRDAIRLEESLLPEAAQEELFQKVEQLIRAVVVPTYARLAVRFTRRERNDFYLVQDPLHGLERAGWALAGTIVGGLVIWAPFIPLWSKEWVLPFFLAGLFFPNLRRLWEVHRLERELNRVVLRADQEISRVDLGYLLNAPQTTAQSLGEKAPGKRGDRRQEDKAR